jgi:hypothetical protein
MSEVPPIAPSPPPQFVEYPRAPDGVAYGSAEKFKALTDGYFGLGIAFALVLLTSIIAIALAVAVHSDVLTILVFFVLVPVVAFVLPLRANKQVAIGKDWSPGLAYVFSLVMMVGGIIPYAIVQTIALEEMKRYGLKRRFFGIRKKDAMALYEQLLAAQPSKPF